ncbi:DEAD/DEAH box helicase [Chryseobacterium populi]|uniref:Lhr-like helicase n=1 Tax=Chryseobacterium populi TaxID=1144316 RepID=J3CPI0_9FLAO|nr:DEAD/DEAH box helicase [Chryseobacterium populi]EJL75904.1 Lhr-like helicase [Chryseobacterium populi]
MTAFENTNGFKVIQQWMADKDISPFRFQLETWQKYAKRYSGMVIAPTGFGKTYSVFLALISDYLTYPDQYKKGLKMIWVTPLRSLSKDIAKAMQEAIDEIGLDWAVGVRNGDTDPKVRQQQVKSMPEILVVTPESLHLLLAKKSHARFFNALHCIAVDEWHELLGSKRVVMVELAVSQLRKYVPEIKIWGITATTGNLDEAMEALIPYPIKKTKITAKEQKKIEILSY